MGEPKQNGPQVDCDRSLEYSSRGLLRRPVSSDSCNLSCRRPRYRLNAHEMAVGPLVIRGSFGYRRGTDVIRGKMGYASK